MRVSGGPHPRGAVRPLLAVYLVGLAAITLLPQPAPAGTMSWIRRSALWLADQGVPVTFLGLEAVGNVLLFVPFGVLVSLVLGLRRWAWVLLLGSATSAAIELSQLLFLPSRFATVQDWVLNTSGTAVGLGVLALVRARRGPGPMPGPGPVETVSRGASG